MAHIWQISIVAFENKTLILGVALKENAKSQKQKMSPFKNLLKLLGTYAKKPLKNKNLVVHINENEHFVKTNDSGAFRFELDYCLKGEPNLEIKYKNEVLIINQDFPVFFEYKKNNCAVISDLDDTIIVSHTANAIKRIGTLAFVSPHHRKTIELTEFIIQKLENLNASIYYISKSESNLFGFISSIFQYNNLPKGVFFLTPYIKFKELFNRKKGKDYKLSSIEYVLKNSGSKKFILFGDDTQKDMEVYRIIAEKYPEKIAKIYIRQTKSSINKTKDTYWKKLVQSCKNSIYFNKNTNIEQEWISLESIIKI